MQYGICNKPVVPLYETAELCLDRPDNGSGIADELLYGWTCRIVEEIDRGRILKVITEYDYEGYVRRADMIVFSRNHNYTEYRPVKYVNRNTVDILSMPKVQGKVLTTVFRGSYLKVSDDFQNNEGWQQVILNNAIAGYVQEVMLSERKKSPLTGQEGYYRDVELRADIIESARAYLGTQYRWGGKTPAGIDCSGLSFMSYFENGISIYRDAKIKEGYPVKKIPNHMMDKGDLLFFPGHVAIYMGDGKYIHATAHKDSYGVVINSLYPWDRDFREDLYEKLYAVGSVF